MENPLSKLALDHWYKVLLVSGFIVFLMAGYGLLPEFPTAETALISIGVFFIGLGEWINHPTRSIYIPRSIDNDAGFLTTEVRKPSVMGNVIVVFGLCFAVFGAYKLFS